MLGGVRGHAALRGRGICVCACVRSYVCYESFVLRTLCEPFTCPRAFARSHFPGAPCHGNFKTLLRCASKCRKCRLLELGLTLTACSWRCVWDRRRVTSGPSQTSFNLGNNEAPQFIGAFFTRHVLRAAAATSNMHPLSRRSLAPPFTSSTCPSVLTPVLTIQHAPLAPSHLAIL